MRLTITCNIFSPLLDNLLSVHQHVVYLKTCICVKEQLKGHVHHIEIPQNAALLGVTTLGDSNDPLEGTDLFKGLRGEQ